MMTNWALGCIEKIKTLNFTTVACWIVAMNKKSVFAEFRIKIRLSSLPTFYDSFWLFWHYSIHTLYLIQFIHKSLNGTLYFYQNSFQFQLTTSVKFNIVYKHPAHCIVVEEFCLKTFCEKVVRIPSL